jgi:hypothetical protein
MTRPGRRAAERGELLARRKRLQAELAEAEARLPAHSVRPHQLQAVEELEEALAAVERRLAGGGEQGPG